MEKGRKRSGRGRKSLVALAAAALSTPAVGADGADPGDPSGAEKAGATGEAQQLDGQRERTNTIFSKPSDTGTPSADVPAIIINNKPGATGTPSDDLPDGQRKRTNTIFSKPSDTGTPSADLPDGEGKRGIIIDNKPGESEAQDVTPEATQPLLKSKSLGGVAPPEGGAPKK